MAIDMGTAGPDLRTPHPRTHEPGGIGHSLHRDSDHQLHGRADAIRLVREIMERPVSGRRPRSVPFPILVFEGPRGAGKTALLDELEQLIDQRVPFARVDLETTSASSVPALLSALAFGLDRRCPRYGTLRFPRLLVGQLVIAQDLDLTSRTTARNQVRELLKQQRRIDQLLDVTQEAAEQMLTIPTGVPVGLLRRLAGLGFDQLARWVWSRLVFLGRYQHWYGRRDGARDRDSIEELVDLNWWHRSADPASRQRVDEVLSRAFLADLRDAFARRRRSGTATLNAVVLVDNADVPLGRRLLTGLVQARTRGRQGAAGADPLTVVVTSRDRLLADVAPEDQATMAPGETAYAELHRRVGFRPSWVAHRLRALTGDEVGAMVGDGHLPGAQQARVASMVHQVTGGHPGSTRLVLDAIASQRPVRVEIREVLQAPDPALGNPRLTVEARLLAGLLDDPVPTVIDDLTTGAAARDRRQLLRLARSAGFLAEDGNDYAELLGSSLWKPGDPAGPALARRLLRGRLASRPDDHPASWATVHGWLRDACERDGDEVGELHHALAAGDVAVVVERLHQRLATRDAGAWLGLLRAVTTAPRPRPARDPLTAEVAEQATQVPGQLRPLARLVTGLWIAADPLSPSRRRVLHLGIAAGFQDMEAHADDPEGLLLREANRHQSQAQWWD